jgi:hypothetical protein
MRVLLHRESYVLVDNFYFINLFRQSAVRLSDITRRSGIEVISGRRRNNQAILHGIARRRISWLASVIRRLERVNVGQADWALIALEILTPLKPCERASLPRLRTYQPLG